MVGAALLCFAVGAPGLPHALVIGAAFAGALAISAAALAVGPRRPDPRRRRVMRVGMILAAIQVTGLARAFRVGVVHPDETAERRAIGEGDAVLTNPRLSSDRVTQPRGRILAADGTVLARSRASGDVFHREYAEPSTYSLVGYDSPLKFGLSGLEASLDDDLTGAGHLTVRGAVERALLDRATTTSSVRLTIELPSQRLAAELLDGLVGSAILVECASGRIIAMASSPTVDPNRLAAFDDESASASQEYWDDVLLDPGRPLLSRATTGLYPPGSTFKVVTASAAIELGLASPDSVFEDSGVLTIGGRALVEHNRPDTSRIEWTLSEGLAYSLNLVYAQVGLEVGGEDLARIARGFGLGESIPTDLPSASGQIASRPAFLDTASALADTAFGQGELLVTPLHMALVATAIARDGTVPIPTLVDRVTAGDDVLERRAPEVWRRAVSEATAAALDQMMVDSATYGYARTAAIEGVRIGAKTGTAESGSDAPHSWFIGYRSGGDRSVAVAVCIEYGGEGGGLALTVGRELLRVS